MFTFPANERLKTQELKEVFKGGERHRDRFLTLIVLRKETGPGKAGFIVRKSKNSAVERNRCKRIMREIYRLNKHRINGHFWIVLILTRQKEKLRFSALEEAFMRICRKAGIIS